MPTTLDTIEVQTLDGRIRGVSEQGLAIFRGVPFAEAPVGALRFRPPVPRKSLGAEVNATGTPAVCPQPPSRLAALMGNFSAEQSEDCLTLSVWAPLPHDRSRPILVWFHGGGYLSGGGGLPWYDGGRLARDNDIMVVSVNYRLGPLGYLYRPGLSDGNMGLLDQICALEWLKRNAAAFGGDGERITLMGQSAGAHSIACLLAMERTRHLAQRAILLSTPFGMRSLPVDEAIASANRLCAGLGIDPDRPGALRQLQDVPVGKIVEATVGVLRSSNRAPGDPTPPFGPTATNGLPGGDAFDSALQEGAAGIDAIVGTTAEEALAFYALDPRLNGLSFERLPGVAQALFGDSWRTRIDSARRTRPGLTALEALSAAMTEYYFVDGSHRLALSAGRNRNMWVFRFDWSAAGSTVGACHCIELPFVFGTFDAFEGAPMLGSVMSERMQALSGAIRHGLGRFVKREVPAGDQLPAWPTFTRARPVYLAFDAALKLGWADISAL